MNVIGTKDRVGRVQRQIRRAFIWEATYDPRDPEMGVPGYD
jgi:hypothetical protein